MNDGLDMTIYALKTCSIALYMLGAALWFMQSRKYYQSRKRLDEIIFSQANDLKRIEFKMKEYGDG